MLDYAQRTAISPVVSGYAGGSSSITGLGIRALMGRLAGMTPTATPAGIEVEFEAGHFPERCADPSLRARAEAAFRTVDGAPERGLDAALAVMEAEIAELRGAVRGYGEALKSIQTYAAEETVRATARGALRARPQRLAAARPVPKLVQDGPVKGRPRHG